MNVVVCAWDRHETGTWGEVQWIAACDGVRLEADVELFFQGYELD